MKTGMIITAAIAGLFTTAALADNTPAAGTSSTVHCSGINSCKGTSSCKTASNACKGQNSCKGKGVVETATAKECTDKGGKVEGTK